MKVKIERKIICRDCGTDHEVYLCRFGQGKDYFCLKCAGVREVEHEKILESSVCITCGKPKTGKSPYCFEHYYENLREKLKRVRCKCGRMARQGIDVCHYCLANPVVKFQDSNFRAFLDKQVREG